MAKPVRTPKSTTSAIEDAQIIGTVADTNATPTPTETVEPTPPVVDTPVVDNINTNASVITEDLQVGDRIVLTPDQLRGITRQDRGMPYKSGRRAERGETFSRFTILTADEEVSFWESDSSVFGANFPAVENVTLRVVEMDALEPDDEPRLTFRVASCVSLQDSLNAEKIQTQRDVVKKFRNAPLTADLASVIFNVKV